MTQKLLIQLPSISHLKSYSQSIALNIASIKKGNIINISSILSKTGFNGLSVYGFAKSGQVGFTKSLARELGKLI